ncbi:MAG: hypothetical protein COZ28_03175 [Candidatus Moranbacteria bacterium CG_4_10_14_3_um_filter_44_15]|nr:MAG: hypothetical protein COS72_01635 [Candidatus Moranbacteria bacterium CG06_land_8_20_14_3_00_43_56]PIV84024.1 MAG: hypothetical protein COW51_01900 [Candidatus Moranbacteria bacterium CG17_big_fil_post_rev_8_21_14_2_50_44_12]PIW93074.1 MAG: hypothetical protein COZ87_03305 [Candidatus Moranbacteria bacterium CG_4_8_14_3_um_filter_43_15]PIX90541.1 MAG: hypothetical protein COZ28_03175 [Candidatus Moranbacteria bacterium CG_4_10_14_3_um_filter_44_15]PJA85334.1 MAG: hypothetical protein CO1
MKRKVLLGLTTTFGSDWRAKIKEIDKLKIQEIALFPTCLGEKNRKELYALLEKTSLLKILFIHLRDDMQESEIDYLVNKFGAECFNLHPEEKAYQFVLRSKYRDRIYIENLYSTKHRLFFNKEIFQKYNIAGVCLDFSHLAAEEKVYPDYYPEKLEIIKNTKIGCNHLSVCYPKKKFEPTINSYTYDSHYMEKLSNLDYLKNYPISFFSNMLAIELENSFKEQLEAKKYIEELIRRKENE